MKLVGAALAFFAIVIAIVADVVYGALQSKKRLTS